jgi:hypothetical protein
MQKLSINNEVRNNEISFRRINVTAHSLRNRSQAFLLLSAVSRIRLFMMFRAD